MKKIFFWKVFSVFFLVITFFLSINFLITINFLRKQQINNILENLKNVIDSVEGVTKNFTKIENEKSFEGFIHEITKKTNIRITIIALDGKVVLDSEKDASTMENHSDRPEFKKAIETGYAQSIRWSPTLEIYMIYSAKKTDKFIIRGSLPAKKISIVPFLKNFNRYFFICILFGIVLSFFISRFLYFPIEEILTLTEKLKDDQEIKDSIFKRRDETGKIIKNIVELKERTALIEEKEKFLKNALEQFIKIVDFPVAIIETEGDISVFNESFKNLFEIEEKRLFWWEKIKHFDISTMIKETTEKKEKIEKEIMVKDRYFIYKSMLLPESKKVLVMLVDITEIKGFEEKRKDFLIAVSHELKTPLTAIKGYIETLLDEVKDPEKHKYIEIVHHNVERMTRILEDLITLSQIENLKIKPEMKKTNIARIAENVFLLFEKKATQKGLKLLLNVHEVPDVIGNEFKLEQMLINLVDNAIRFTEKGKVEICVYHQRDNNNVVIEVCDTGIGIEQKYIPHIFEKFFVVDKSRSRYSGGTGLGLSIVKSIVLMHNGKIEVESTPGKGTKFTIILPA